MSQQRIKKVQAILKEFQADALIIENVTDLFYLTGLDLSVGSLIITPAIAELFVDGRYFEACKTTTICSVTLNSDKAIPAFLDVKQIKKLAFDSDSTPYKRFLLLQKWAPQLLPVEGPLKKIRAIKEVEEMECLKNAANLGCRGYDIVTFMLKEGITEASLAQQLKIYWLTQGGQGIAFEPIIAFGANSSKPHYRAGESRLKKGDAVLIDIGVTLNHYHSDMTRVVFFEEAPKQLTEVYEIVRQAQQAAIDACKEGVTVGKLDDIARDLISKKGYGEKFTHSLGHGIGLEVHEFPTLRNHITNKDILLKAGMAITLEPGIYLPGIGGIRIEDTVIVTKDGCINLTNRTKELKIVKTVK